MQQSNWLTIEDAEILYENINRSSIEMAIHNSKDRDEDITMWYKQSNGIVYINVKYLMSIWERRRYIQLKAQDMYYEIIETMSEWELCNLFGKYSSHSQGTIYNFINRTLFMNTYYINLSNRVINPLVIQFYNFCLELLEPVSFDSIEEECDYNDLKRIINE